MKVAIVLGNRMNDDGSLSDKMIVRLNLALKLYKEISPDKIIVSGGIANKKAGIAEAEKMHEWLIQNGIPFEVVLKEVDSKSTKQNAKFSVPIAKSLGADEIILCTSSEHFARKWLNPEKLFKAQLKHYSVKLTCFSN